MKRLPVILLLALASAGACARAFPPPGGELDRTPPRLVSTTPEPLSIVPGYGEPVVFRFDERISERGFSEALVVVSPLDGALRVDRGRSEVRVQIDGGWQSSRVYRIVILPGLRDLFGNARDEPVELVFSTGPPVANTAIAGLVSDPISDRPPRSPVVTAIRRADSTSYLALGDTAGFFALRHLPLGEYELRAFSDQNGNRRRDASEPVDSGRVVILGAPDDTMTTIFRVLAPDSTPPELDEATVVDSLHVRVTFDDYLDPAAAPDAVQGRVLMLPDSTPYAQLAGAIHPTMWDMERRAAADSAAARAPADTTGVRPPPRQQPPRRMAEGPPSILPNRSLVVRLDRALAPATKYVIMIGNVVNLRGLRGGGTADFETRAAGPPGGVQPPRPDTASIHLRQ